MKSRYKLRANWSKREKDIMLHYPLGVGTSRDASFLSKFFNDDFIKEMESRGYDVTKMRFEIPIKPGQRLDKFETLNSELQEN